MRTGSEPSQARSPLRLRLGLAVLALASALVAAGLLLIWDATEWVLACVAVAVVSLTDIVVVLRHIRAGPHYQPGRDIPPYRPVEDPGPTGAGHHVPVPMRVRRRRYIALMGLCLVLFVSSWTWVRQYSTTAAVVVSLLAMAIPPVAVVVANAGSTLDRR